MAPIYITMLGHFDILVEDRSMLSYLGKTPKGILLLKYLILNRDRLVTVAELVEAFWSQEERTKSENALKTMISRLRASLTKASSHMADCILSEKRAYRWNPDLPCEVDVFLFEAQCETLADVARLDAEVKQQYRTLLELYQGDLSYSAGETGSIAARSQYLHHLYFKSVYRYIEMLRAVRDYDEIVHVCRIALEIESFDEKINLELMQALQMSGQKSAALAQYRHLTDAYYKFLGTEPPEKLLDFYKSLIKSDISTESDIDSIQEDLREAGDRKGALVCDYYIFKEIFQFQYRNAEHQQNNVFLMLIRVKMPAESGITPLVLDGVMKDLLDILQMSLRKGDTVARYSPAQYVLLLPMEKPNSIAVISRIKEMFYRRYAEEDFRLVFQTGSILSNPNGTLPRI